MLLGENKPLAPFTTFGIGGPARWFAEAKSEEDLVEAVERAQGKGIRLFILGGGSNLLVSDAGFDGLVLHIGLMGVVSSCSPGQVLYQVAAGEDWDQFVQRIVDENSAGMECLAGIPGTVGGTPVQNVGAYGQEVASSIVRVRAFDLNERSFVELTNEECQFAYRRSRFNTTDQGRFIVTRVDYRLHPGGAPTLRYPDLERAFSSGTQPTLKEVAARVREVRRSKGMLLVEGDPDCRSAGSFFKNPVVSEDRVAAICDAAGKELPRYPAGPGPENNGRVKIPAAWLIEHAGFAKGYTLGPAGVSPRHTLALVNRGGATAKEILTLADLIRAGVAAQFNITLEMEPVMLGF
jgi:UDP-N-acetylmuramate dehydrogenase